MPRAVQGLVLNFHRPNKGVRLRELARFMGSPVQSRLSWQICENYTVVPWWHVGFCARRLLCIIHVQCYLWYKAWMCFSSFPVLNILCYVAVCSIPWLHCRYFFHLPHRSLTVQPAQTPVTVQNHTRHHTWTPLCRRLSSGSTYITGSSDATSPFHCSLSPFGSMCQLEEDWSFIPSESW